MFKALIDPLVAWYDNALHVYGVPVVGLMMALESTIVPIPSEAIIPRAAYLAHAHPDGNLSIARIIIAGMIGSWLGASIMYWAARLAGRPLLFQYGRYAMISPEKIEGAERWTTYYGSMGVFIARLLPGIRHLIGIPTGIVRMDFRLYSLFTLLGSGIWCGVLCWLGIKMGQDEELMKGGYRHMVIWLAGIVAVLGGIYYFFVHRHMTKAGSGGR